MLVQPVKSLEARHCPSGFNTGFQGEQLSFADYVTQSRNMLFSARAKGHSVQLEKIVEGNAPFELKPAEVASGCKKSYRRGILLTHGLTDSPYFMRHLAAFFQQSGFRVMAILLPGHGTQPGDLLDTRWQEWAKAVAYGVDRLDEEVEELYLAGFSAGGTLSVYQSLHDQRVRGLFLFSPALKVSPRAAFANAHKLYSWLMPTGKWLYIRPDHDIYKYESFPKNAAAQMYALTRKLGSQLQLHEMDLPVFAAASEDDATANTTGTLEFMSRTRHPSSRLVIYSARPDAFSFDIPAEKLELVNCAMPVQKILSSAHTAIILPAEDTYYGAGGAYSNCTHYYPGDMEKYNACAAYPEQILLGEITPQNLDAGLLCRLMFNPHFAALKISMQRFIDNL